MKVPYCTYLSFELTGRFDSNIHNGAVRTVRKQHPAANIFYYWPITPTKMSSNFFTSTSICTLAG